MDARIKSGHDEGIAGLRYYAMMWPEFGARASAMRVRLALILPVLAAAAPLASCATAVQGPADMARQITRSDPTGPYIGMTKAEVIACAGQPHSRYGGAAGETLTYHYSGAGPVPSPEKDDKKQDDKKQKSPFAGIGGKKKDDGNWDCTASFAFDGDRVTRISFAHKNVDSPYAWQKEKDPEKAEKMREAGVPTCAFSLPNCPR
jgi:hypothetical protein